MKKISGIGLVRFQENKKNEEISEMIAKNNSKLLLELAKENKQKDIALETNSKMLLQQAIKIEQLENKLGGNA
mgnify:CR=1 FL=1